MHALQPMQILEPSPKPKSSNAPALEIASLFPISVVVVVDLSRAVFGQVNIVDGRGRAGEYTGSMRNGLADGMGVCLYQRNGIFLPYRYEGEFLAGKEHGQGKLFWIDGATFEGAFVENKMTGAGAASDKHGNIFKSGRWMDDRFVG